MGEISRPAVSVQIGYACDQCGAEMVWQRPEKRGGPDWTTLEMRPDGWDRWHKCVNGHGATLDRQYPYFAHRPNGNWGDAAYLSAAATNLLDAGPVVIGAIHHADDSLVEHLGGTAP